MATKKAYVRNKHMMKDLGLLVSTREERRKAERKAKKLALKEAQLTIKVRTEWNKKGGE